MTSRQTGEVSVSEELKAFESWLCAVDREAVASGFMKAGESYTMLTGFECWIDAFEDGDSPEQAWEEEMSAATSMA